MCSTHAALALANCPWRPMESLYLKGFIAMDSCNCHFKVVSLGAWFRHFLQRQVIAVCISSFVSQGAMVYRPAWANTSQIPLVATVITLPTKCWHLQSLKPFAMMRRWIERGLFIPWNALLKSKKITMGLGRQAGRQAGRKRKILTKKDPTYLLISLLTIFISLLSHRRET